MQPLLPRHLTAELHEALLASRVVNVIGPRQSGKTTLVRDLFGTGRYVTLDDTTVLRALEEDAFGQLTALLDEADSTPLIIDEAQRSTGLAIAVKRIVDTTRQKGRFILTGSSNVFASQNVVDSLPGRIRTLTLWPMAVSELERIGPPRILDWALSRNPTLTGLPDPARLTRDGYIDYVIRGGFPETRMLDTRQRNRQYRDYVDSVVDRDVADIVPVRKTDALRRLIDQMASRTAAEVNVAGLAGDIGIERPTVMRYIDVLERLLVVRKLGAWTSGEAKREIKHPKYHFVDTGVASALRRITADTFAADANPTALGPMLETFAHGELVKSLPFQERDIRLYHWRGANKAEIDVVADAGDGLVGIEVKASTAVAAGDVRTLRWFGAEGPGRARRFTGIVFYLGTERLTFGDRIFALPVSQLWSQAGQA